MRQSCGIACVYLSKHLTSIECCMFVDVKDFKQVSGFCSADFDSTLGILLNGISSDVDDFIQLLEKNTFPLPHHSNPEAQGQKVAEIQRNQVKGFSPNWDPGTKFYSSKGMSRDALSNGHGPDMWTK